MKAWYKAWNLAKTSIDLKGKALADRALGELAYLYARLGQVTKLHNLLKSINGRSLCGHATEKIACAQEGLWNMINRPEMSFRCGSLALHSINHSIHPKNSQSNIIDATKSTELGISLHQLSKISHIIGLDFQMAFRNKDAELIVPSVVHFKLEHFVAIIGRDGDKYQLQDSTLKDNMWITKETLEAECSGYFLIPPGKLAEGWTSVDDMEGQTIWGKGFVGDGPPPPGPCDLSTDPSNSCPGGDGGGPGGDGGGPGGDGGDGSDGGGSCGLAVVSIHLLNASLNIIDRPLGSSGPSYSIYGSI